MANKQATPPAAKLVYVVTLTWNQKMDTLACLQSLSQMTYPHYRLLLVDNASSDGTVGAVGELFPHVEIVVNPCNLGFQGGFNTGLQYALEQGADHVLIINNDTEVAPDMLDRLMDHATQPGVGILAPKIYYANPPDLIWSVGGDCHPWLLEMINKGDKQWDRGQWDELLERDFLVGCALLFSRELLTDVGMFDMLYYPIYYEDVDLCLRARRAGYRLLLVPQARMWHKVSASGGGADSPRERYLMARNSVRYFRKHVRGARWLAVIPWRLGSATKTVARLMVQKKGKAALAYMHGLRDGLIQTKSPAGPPC